MNRIAKLEAKAKQRGATTITTLLDWLNHSSSRPPKLGKRFAERMSQALAGPDDPLEAA